MAACTGRIRAAPLVAVAPREQSRLTPLQPNKYRAGTHLMKLDSTISAVITGGASKTVSRDRQTQEIKEYPLDNFERIIQINLIGTFRCITKSAAGMLKLPPLADGDRGAIVNTASVAAEDGQIGQAAYTASKAGIVGLTLVVARDLSSEAIRVNTILPGIFDTPLLARAPERVKASLAASVPFPKRLGRPEEYAALAELMITNGYFNGESVRLDGAIRMAPR